jgi:uncharacterized protein YjiK
VTATCSGGPAALALAVLAVPATLDAADAADAAAAAAGGAPLEVVFREDRLLQWKLPKRLREISGLALTVDGRLLALADERGEISEIDFRAGALMKRFGIGDPVLAGDFEGIAATDEAVFAVTSGGTLVRFPEGGNGAHVPYEVFVTGLGDICEIEGLAWEPRRDSLLLACKEVHDGDGGEVWLFRWEIAAARLEFGGPLRAPGAQMAQALGEAAFNPSGVSVDDAGDTLWLVAARQHAVARLRLGDGRRLALVDVRRFPAAHRHRQSEGIALLPGGAVAIADEGGKQGRGRLGVYGRP